jgi:phosphoserine phosphatase
MKKISSGIYSSKTPDELSDILGRSDKKNRAVISDFDGTLFRGTTGHILHGMSISYLSLYLLPHLLNKPQKAASFIAHNTDIISLLWEGRNKTDQDHKTNLESEVVQTYCNKVLGGIPEQSIECAAKVLQFHVYRKSLDLFSELSSPEGTSAIVTKTIREVIEPVRRSLNLKYDIRPDIIANTLSRENGSITGLDYQNPILTVYDKAAYLGALLDQKSNITHAVVLGDTSEDIGMFDAVRERYGNQNTLTVALHPKDKLIRESADCMVTNIPAFYSYLKDMVSEQPTSTPAQETPVDEAILPLVNYNFVQYH